MSSGKIVLIATGGTISTRDSGAGAVPGLDARDLLREAGAGPSGFDVSEFARIPGCEMTPARMAALAALVSRELGRDDCVGAVVTHGTDTIEESSFLCHLTVGSDKPVVFTGSMRTSSERSWDGPRNLLDAVLVARSDKARALGTLLVMNEEVHSARFVTKSNGLTLGAFRSPPCGPLGRIYNGELMLFTRPAAIRRALAPRVDESVAMLSVLSGDSAALEAVTMRPAVRGLVVAGFGSGRVPFSWLAPLRRSVERGVIVALASRTGGGAIGDSYGYTGARYLVEELGLIAAHEMAPHQARIKLMLALGNGLDREATRKYFDEEWRDRTV